MVIASVTMLRGTLPKGVSEDYVCLTAVRDKADVVRCYRNYVVRCWIRVVNGIDRLINWPAGAEQPIPNVLHASAA